MRQTIEGSDAAVRARLIEMQRSGELVAQAAARQLGRRRVAVEVVVRPIPVTPAVKVRRVGLAIATLIGAALVSALVLAMWWLADHMAQIAAGALVLLVLWFAVTRLNHSGACLGLHCDGCPGGHR